MYSNTTETFPFASTSFTNNNLTLNNNNYKYDQINSSSSPSFSSHHDHLHYGRRDKVVFFEMHFEEHQTQLTFAFWFFITILAKIGDNNYFFIIFANFTIKNKNGGFKKNFDVLKFLAHTLTIKI